MTSTAEVYADMSVEIDVRTSEDTFDESVVDRWELEAARRALRNLKTLVGKQGMVDLLAEQIEAGDQFHRDLVAASGGTFRESRTEFTVRGLTGTELATWFQELFAAGLDDATIINAHPEHYVWPPAYSSGLVEMIGGHMTRFQGMPSIDPPEAVREYLDPEFPLTLMCGTLCLDDGTPIAYSLHQARDAGTGADLAVRVIYPSAAPDSMIEAHNRHMAIEFRSWVRFAAAARAAAR